MSALLKTLTFKALRQKPIPARNCANHEFLDYIITKWDIHTGDELSTVSTCSRINHCVYLETSKDGSSDRLVFNGDRESYLNDRVVFSDLGSPLTLYRLGCTFPSAVRVEQTDKSAWWSALTHKATGKFFGFDDIKGAVALRIRPEEVYVRNFRRKNGDRESIWRALVELKGLQSVTNVQEPYLCTLPQEMVDNLSKTETGDPDLLEELKKFVEDNKVFKRDMLALLSYLASDQCVHGYDDLVAGYEA
ncbi:hypothetical protein EC991_005411 [Linnemannia zychae]|nr:hypothetical protein EC991_005411 [Linnemannia zychae]